jgi:transposase
MPPRYVKPYVKRNKNGAADAEAICEAVTRPNMRFVPFKTAAQKSVLMLQRTRQLFVRQRRSKPFVLTWRSLASSPVSGAMVLRHC